MKLFTRIFMFALVVMVGALILIGVPGPEAQAELTKGKAVTLIGYSIEAGATGNTVAASTGVRVGRGSEWPTQYTCYGFVANSTGLIPVNTATAAVQTSYDNSNFTTETTLTLGPSNVVSATDATSDLGKYWRVNVTAIQNANTYATVQCLFD